MDKPSANKVQSTAVANTEANRIAATNNTKKMAGPVDAAMGQMVKAKRKQTEDAATLEDKVEKVRATFVKGMIPGIARIVTCAKE